ncbi:hypothetical protein T4B_11689 [Trichinella pseudospiralis]|uniref:Uncharacterized protein n=1 Tax=Trichinella pseudospiralis TaxID=6337 RepID=A0A0V1ENP8_TRIPS|nr:hypothetical protein T4A_1171 [Trichinella pseudospiralis]KRZ23362.1 hypothetical protein T4B_11689 [Trichinella pseudospiralis]KRZ38543.1 hypothetical protein T4C_3146 [Trichinella pseudospiralis]
MQLISPPSDRSDRNFSFNSSFKTTTSTTTTTTFYHSFLYDEINERVQVRFIARSLPASSQIIRALDIDYQSKAKVVSKTAQTMLSDSPLPCESAYSK